LVGASDNIDDPTLEETKVAFVKQSLSETVERILEESTALAKVTDAPLQEVEPPAAMTS
jgi:hypothetical protein